MTSGLAMMIKKKDRCNDLTFSKWSMSVIHFDIFIAQPASWIWNQISNRCVRRCIYVGGTCQVDVHVNSWRQDHTLITLPLPAVVVPWFILVPWCTRTQPSMCCKGNQDSLDQTTFFHCSKVQFGCVRAYFMCFPII